MNDDVCAVKADRIAAASPSDRPAEYPARDAHADRAAAWAAPLLAIGSMCSIQLGAALSQPVMEAYGIFSTTWLRLCFAALVLAAIVRPPLRTYTRAQWMSAIALGGAMAMMTLCFFAALRHVPLGLAVAIDFMGPLAVAAFGVRKPSMLVWPVLAAAGVVLLARQDGMWVASPDLLMLPAGAALGWAAYIVLMKRVGKQFKGLQGLSMSLIAAALVATPFGIMQSGGHIPRGQWVSVAYLAVLVPLLPYVLELTALRRMKASAFGMLMSAEPAIAAGIGFAVLGQALSGMQIVGVMLVVGASVAAVRQG
ncbi:EamA family transporter [Burkholderia alba]|uniref:EamA family transporter n=1 Tax=Burkholderia alba TaxID=2683677 RepID=UPI002B053D01|nr:EamA family transporter [Burkholderia alba]